MGDSFSEDNNQGLYSKRFLELFLELHLNSNKKSKQRNFLILKTKTYSQNNYIKQ